MKNESNKLFFDFIFNNKYDARFKLEYCLPDEYMNYGRTWIIIKY